MAQINFKGKSLVWNHHLGVEYHELVPDKSKSLTDSVSLKDNLIIHGDNLKALKALLPTYAGKVKCIYIDPPYNTGNEGWVYSDNVSSPMIQEWLKENKPVDGEDLTRHDKWLCMITPRIKLLRELLADDGVIFISIDDNEKHHLRDLLDEIFGEENFIVCFPRRTKAAGKTTDAVALNHDYVLAYAKDSKRASFGTVIIDDSSYKYKDEHFEERGPYDLSQALDYDSLQYSPSLDYELELGGMTFCPGGDKAAFLSRRAGNHRASDWAWRWSKDLVKFGQENDFLVVKKGRDGNPRIYTKTYYKATIEKNNGSYRVVPIERSKKLSTLDLLESRFSNDVAKKDLRDIFGPSAEFPYPKPVSLADYLIKAVASNKDALIFDSFAGSATTAQAVLEMNKEDGGNRKFILVEMEDYADEITAERVRRVIKNGTPGSFSYFELGDAIDEVGILSGKKLPSHEQMARYLFYTATGEEFDESKVEEAKNFIGASKDYEVYLFYKPDIEYLKNTALNLEKAKALPAFSGKRRLVFAPAKYLDQETLNDYNIDFAQLPYEIYKKAN